MCGFSRMILCAVFVILWSFGWVGSKYAMGLTGPFTFLTWRYVAVVVLLGLAVIVTGKWQKISLEDSLLHLNVGILAHGVFLAAGLGAMQLGLSAGMAAFVTAMQPLLTAIVAHRFTNEAPTRRQWYGIGLGLLAVAIVIGSGITLGGSAAAYILVICSLIAVSLATVLDKSSTLKRIATKQHQIPLPQVLFLHSLAGLVLFSMLGYSLEGLEVVWTEQLIKVMAFMVIIVSIGSYGVLFLLLRHISLIKVSALIYLTPPTTMIMAWMLFGETLSVIQWCGLSLAAIAVGIVYSDDIRKSTTTRTADLSENTSSVGRFAKPVS